MILFIDKYYSSAANYISTGMEKKKLDLDLVIRKSKRSLLACLFQVLDVHCL